MNTDPLKSAQPCGCDEGANHKCQWHRKEEPVENSRQQTDVLKSLNRIGDAHFLENWQEPGEVIRVGNGVQTEFGNGATRSTDVGKIDYEGHISPRVLTIYGEYMNEHRVQRDGKLRGSDNWQEGIPLHRYAKSLIRHVHEFHCMWRGETVINVDNNKPFTFRTVLCAIMFNVMGILFEMSREYAGKSWLDSNFCIKDLRQAIERGETK